MGRAGRTLRRSPGPLLHWNSSTMEGLQSAGANRERRSVPSRLGPASQCPSAPCALQQRRGPGGLRSGLADARWSARPLAARGPRPPWRGDRGRAGGPAGPGGRIALPRVQAGAGDGRPARCRGLLPGLIRMSGGRSGRRRDGPEEIRGGVQPWPGSVARETSMSELGFLGDLQDPSLQRCRFKF